MPNINNNGDHHHHEPTRGSGKRVRDRPLIVIDQLKYTKDPEIRENLLLSLKAFLNTLDRDKQMKLMKESPGLRNVVERIYKSTSEPPKSNDDYDLTATKAICEELLDLIDHFQQQH